MRHWALRPNARPRDVARLLPLLLLFWLALTGGRHLAVGLLAAAAAATVSAMLMPFPRARYSAAGTLRLVLHFLYRSVEGGLDVAGRAMHPHMPLVRDEGWRELGLSQGPARHLYTAAACLMPGTLVCRDDDARVWVHSISEDPKQKLDDLERAVRRMFPAERGGAGP